MSRQAKKTELSTCFFFASKLALGFKKALFYAALKQKNKVRLSALFFRDAKTA
jgi:hypothetical protein